MLTELSIRDFVLIERQEIAFGPGLTVVTGATGDGKTLVFRALRFLLGERVSPERVIRPGAERAVVEGTLVVPDPALRRELRDLGAPEDWDEPELTVSREVDRGGRGKARIGGRLATALELRRLGERLVEGLGQGDAQALARGDRQRRILDAYARTVELRARFTSGRAALLERARARDEAWRTAGARDAERERRRHELDALVALAPEDGEWEELERERARLAGGETLRRALEQAGERLVEGEGAAVDALRRSARELERVAALLPRLKDAIATLATAADEVAGAARALEGERARCEADPARLDQVEERLSAWRDLARRANVAPEALPARRAALAALASDGGTDDILAHDRALADDEAALARLGIELGERRRAAGRRLALAARRTLEELALPGARIAVELEPIGCSGRELPEPLGGATSSTSAEERLAARFPSPEGCEAVSFLFQASAAQAPAPLGKAASGGELSRVALALAREVARTDDTPVLLLDEVDQNVGGRLGPALGRVLRDLASSRQVVAITHLPSVAAHAGHHLLVSKSPRDARTRVAVLEKEERVREIAAMIGGEPVTVAALAEARDLLGRGTARSRHGRARPRARVPEATTG